MARAGPWCYSPRAKARLAGSAASVYAHPPVEKCAGDKDARKSVWQPTLEVIMKKIFLKFAIALLASAVTAAVFAHGGDPKDKTKGEKLGRV